MEPPLSPNEALAEQIVASLIAQGVLSPQRADEARQRLASGTAKETDWRLWIEEAEDMREDMRKGDGHEPGH